jgi:hypothetical protein
MVEITYQMVLSTVQTISLVVGIVYYIAIMRNNQKTNKTNTLIQRMQTHDRSYYKAWANVLNINYETPEEWIEKYRYDVNPEVYADWAYIGSIYHNVGYLLKHGLVDPDTIFELYPPSSVIRIWRIYKVMVEYLDNVRGSELWCHIKYLNDEAERRFPELKTPDYY